MKSRLSCLALLIGLLVSSTAEESAGTQAPTEDRVGFPEGYAEKFQVLRSFNKAKDGQVVTVFGNERAATVTQSADLPYPYGSVLVMETAAALKGTDGKPLTNPDGSFRRGAVAGMHVMRREKGFGAAYGKNRTGEWEYVEYRADKSYLTTPQKSAVCAECHVKAGEKRDFVYRGRLPAESK